MSSNEGAPCPSTEEKMFALFGRGGVLDWIWVDSIPFDTTGSDPRTAGGQSPIFAVDIIR